MDDVELMGASPDLIEHDKMTCRKVTYPKQAQALSGARN
jgi:hypothetical protein